MYNEITKNLWLSTVSSVSIKNACKTMLKYANAVENKLGKDLGEFTVDEIYSVLNSIDGYSLVYFRTNISMIKMYLKWYSENVKVVPAHVIMGIKTSGVDFSRAMEKMLIKSPLEFMKYKNLYPPEEGYYIFPALYLYWYGLDIDEVYNLKNEDVLIEDDLVRITTSGGEFRFCDEEAATVISEYIKARSGKRATGAHSGGFMEVYPDDIGYFIKVFRPKGEKVRAGKRITKANFSQVVVAALTTFPRDNPLTVPDIIKSGGFYRLFMLEQQKGEITEADIIKVFRIASTTGQGKAVSDKAEAYKVYKKVFWSEK